MNVGTEHVRTAKPEHQVLYADLNALVGKHAAKIDAVEILAIAANMVGKLIALQDQRTMTKETALEIVKANLEIGNAEAIAAIMDSKGSG